MQPPAPTDKLRCALGEPHQGAPRDPDTGRTLSPTVQGAPGSPLCQAWTLHVDFSVRGGTPSFGRLRTPYLLEGKSRPLRLNL